MLKDTQDPPMPHKQDECRIWNHENDVSFWLQNNGFTATRVLKTNKVQVIYSFLWTVIYYPNNLSNIVNIVWHLVIGTYFSTLYPFECQLKFNKYIKELIDF